MTVHLVNDRQAQKLAAASPSTFSNPLASIAWLVLSLDSLQRCLSLGASSQVRESGDQRIVVRHRNVFSPVWMTV